MIYLTNAFSLNMLERAPAHMDFLPITKDEAREQLGADFFCAIGHADTAAVVGSDLNLPLIACRDNVTLQAGDTLIVAQYHGPRLAEGTTTLPVGARIEYWLVRRA